MGKNKKKKFVGWKSNGRVVEVEIDPSSDESTNNGRAKRIERYFSNLRYQYEKDRASRHCWLGVKDSAPVEISPITPSVEICLTQPQQIAEVVEALSALRLRYKVDLSIRLVDARPKSSPQPVMKYHECSLVPAEGNRLRCTVCARTIPLTHGGEIDKDQLMREILARRSDRL